MTCVHCGQTITPATRGTVAEDGTTDCYMRDGSRAHRSTSN